MKKFLFLLVFLFALKTYSQDLRMAEKNTIISLPIVGDTIDHEEKVKFVLFEEIPNNEYFFSTITTTNSDTILTQYKKGDTLQKKINAKYIASMNYNIRKLNSYYNSIQYENENEQKNLSLISNPDPTKTHTYERKRLDSLLVTDPADYNKIKKKQNKNKKKWPNRNVQQQPSDPYPTKQKEFQKMYDSGKVPH